MTASLADLLFGSYRRDILALLLLHPESSLHVREIARVILRAPGTTLRELDRLAEAGALLRKRSGNQVHYQANVLCPVYDELRSILKKTTAVADVLRAALEPLTPGIRFAFVYGSVARGDERPGSDLDVMVIGDVRFEDVVGALWSAHETLRREINPSVYSSSEFAAKAAAGNPFLRRVLADRKILLIGTEDDLGELATNRQVEAARRVSGRNRSPAHGSRNVFGRRQRSRA